MGDDFDVTTIVTELEPAADAVVSAARAALLDETEAASVGDHLDHEVEDGHAVTHHFACTLPGYVGWRWAVTVALAPGSDRITVDEVVLVPGGEAVVAPSWVPYRERIRPGDLSPGDLLPVADDDPRLVPTYSFGDDPLEDEEKGQIRAVAQELYLGRVRALSPEGRDLAQQRWYSGEAGPQAKIAQAAPDHCWSCGFLVRLSGPLSATFGVCANGSANDDGRIVSLDHGCGAHSEVRLAKKHRPLPPAEHVFDTVTQDDIESL